MKKREQTSLFTRGSFVLMCEVSCHSHRLACLLWKPLPSPPITKTLVISITVHMKLNVWVGLWNDHIFGCVFCITQFLSWTWLDMLRTECELFFAILTKVDLQFFLSFEYMQSEWWVVFLRWVKFFVNVRVFSLETPQPSF